MGSLANETISSTYDGLIKTNDEQPLPASGVRLLQDGSGNNSALSIGQANQGATVTGTLTATAFSGDLTGDVTGDLTGSVLTAAQTNITSVGTLSSLAVSGDVSIADKIVHTGDTNTAIRFPSADTVTVETAGTERMRIDSSGNVGIGVIPNNHHVSLIKTLQLGTKASIFSYNNNSTDLANNLYFDNSSVDYLYLTSGAASFYRQSGGVHRFNVAPSGTAGTTVSNSEKLAIDSDGLKFNGDSAAANALDDYEEGTWTPTITFTNASVGTTYAIASGKYTKIGNQVNVNGYIFLSNKGSSTGVARVSNLPFTILNNNANYSAASIGYIIAITYANNIMGHGEIGTTSIVLNESSEAGVNSQLLDSNFANNSAIIISMTYFVS